MKKVLVIIYISLTITVIKAQENNNQIITKPLNNIKNIILAINWGSITVEPSSFSDSIKISSVYDNSNKNEINSKNSKLRIFENKENLIINSPDPSEGVFESHDVIITAPQNLNLKLKMWRGGEIYVNDMRGSIEIDNYNGSTKINNAYSWVTVNNFNGEIFASFNQIDNINAISLLTFNGGIKIALPESPNADVVLKTKKHGWIRSDFPVLDINGNQYDNMESNYNINTPNEWNGKINDGGTKIMALTNNGPIEIIGKKENNGE